MKKHSKGSVLFRKAWPYWLVQAPWVLFQSRMFFISFGMRLFSFYLWFCFSAIFSSCIVQISFQLNWIAYSLHRYLTNHPRKGWKEWRLVYVLASRVLFKPKHQFVFIGICRHLCYSSVIIVSIINCSIHLTPHIGRYRCFQWSIITWQGIHIYFFDGEIPDFVTFCRVLPYYHW